MGELRSGSVSLAEIIAYIKQTSQTGRLTIRNDSTPEVPALLTFEAGHLVDARCDGEVGDDLVYRLLGVRGGAYTFEHTPGAIVPERSIARWQELLILAAIGVLSEDDAAPDEADEPEPPAAPAQPAPPAPAAAPVPVMGPPPTAMPTPPAAMPAPPAPAAPPPTRPDPASPAGGKATLILPLPPLRPPTAADAGVGAAPPVARPPRRVPPFRNPVPLPRTAPVPTGLDAPGTDFLALLERLEGERFSGYLAWDPPTAAGRLIFAGGRVVEAQWTEVSGGVFDSEYAMGRFTNAALTDPQTARNIMAYPLDPNFVWSYSALAGGLDRPQDRSRRGIPWSMLLERTATYRLTGTVQVTAEGATAFAFFCQGRLLGEYEPRDGVLSEAAGRPAVLCAIPNSQMDVFTARERADLPSLNHVAWPVERVAAALGQTALAVLGPRANQIVKLIDGARHDPQALRAACTRARQVTRIFIGAEEYEELGRRMDQLLAHLRT
jgi:hypothetical protein